MNTRSAVALSIALLVLFLSASLWYSRTIVVVREKSLPEINNLDFEVSKALNTMELIGEQKMRKETQLDNLYREARAGRDVWNEIEKLESEVDYLEKQHWGAREKWIKLRMLQGLSKGIKIDGYIVALYSSGYNVPRTKNLKSIFEKEMRELESIEKQIEIKRLRLQELRNTAKSGKDVWSEIETLRTEIKKLKNEYYYRKERYYYLKLLQDYCIY